MKGKKERFSSSTEEERRLPSWVTSEYDEYDDPYYDERKGLGILGLCVVIAGVLFIGLFLGTGVYLHITTGAETEEWRVLVGYIFGGGGWLFLLTIYLRIFSWEELEATHRIYQGVWATLLVSFFLACFGRVDIAILWIVLILTLIFVRKYIFYRDSSKAVSG